VTREAPEVAAARIEAARLRGELMDSAHRLQARLSPGTLARQTWQGAKEKGADLAEKSVDAVRARPVAAGSVVAAIALFLAREPLKDLADKVVDSVSGKKPAAQKRPRSRKKTETVE
jgi:Protein of unknown function (DUF3618)